MSCLCKFVPLSPKSASYYFLLDRPAALVGPRASVLDYHLMHAYRADGYYARNIQDRNSFLPSPTFLVLDSLNANTLESQCAGFPIAKLV